jgi:hypothetical protein
MVSLRCRFCHSQLPTQASHSHARSHLFAIPAKSHAFHKSNQLFDIPWTGETEKMKPGRVNQAGWGQRKQEQVIKGERWGSRELRRR